MVSTLVIWANPNLSQGPLLPPLCLGSFRFQLQSVSQPAGTKFSTMGFGPHKKPLPSCFLLTVKCRLFPYCLASQASTTEVRESHS